jgi:hypothetical protein
MLNPKENNDLKVTFGIIVLNGEPFTRYCLRSLYPFAHEIIVVEGACEGAKNIATKEGHSKDETLEVLRNLKKNKDPENKVKIITAEDEGHKNGFWPGEKDEMSQAYAKRATGNYLWQVDIDEFYKEEDMKKIIDMLKNNPTITAVSIPQITFWGGLDYYVDGLLFKEESSKFWAQRYNRIFKWGPNYKYTCHRPPTVCNEKNENLQDLNWQKGDDLIKNKIFLYHYSLLLPKQVTEKCEYYQSANWNKNKKINEWAQNSFMKLNQPFRVHNVYKFKSWLERFNKKHPKQIVNMFEDIKKNKVKCELRNNKDVEKLLNNFFYLIKKNILKFILTSKSRMNFFAILKL